MHCQGVIQATQKAQNMAFMHLPFLPFQVLQVLVVAQRETASKGLGQYMVQTKFDVLPGVCVQLRTPSSTTAGIYVVRRR